MNNQKNCKTCANAIFDKLWGEYKCKIFQHRIYSPDSISDCIEYKKGTPAESKKNEEEED